MEYGKFKDPIWGTVWCYNDIGIKRGAYFIRYEEITYVELRADSIYIKKGNVGYPLKYSGAQRQNAREAYQYISSHYGTKDIREERQIVEEGVVYDLIGVRGRRMKVYEDRVAIKVDVTVGSFLTHNVSDGEKTIYYADCIGVQFKESGSLLIGYIQLETASAMMNNKNSNFFNENTFTFDETCYGAETNQKMREVEVYIKNKVSEYKNKGTQVVAAASAADEILKFKELLDMGIITQEEFDAKKKQLMGL